MIGTFNQWFTQTDVRVTRLMSRYGLPLLRLSVGIVSFSLDFSSSFPTLAQQKTLLHAQSKR
jgi:hypothetical protein